MSSPRIVRLEKSRLLILPGQTVNGCGAVWPSEFFTTLLKLDRAAGAFSPQNHSPHILTHYPPIKSIIFSKEQR